MNHKQLRDKIEKTDWHQYSGPDCYEADDVRPVLLSLLEFEKGKDPNHLGDKILFAVGNNHRGTYYPVLFAALEIIIAISSDDSNPPRQRCALATLNNLHYFEPEIGEYQGCTNEELGSFARKLLTPYSDEAYET